MSRTLPLSSKPARASTKSVGSGRPVDNKLTPYEKADYIEDMVDEMRRMADEGGFDLLAYILDMAYIEAGNVKKRTAPDLQAKAPAWERDET